MKLIAKSHILYNGIDYIPGDELPECDLVNDWIASSAAFWDDEKNSDMPKARPVTAVPGLVAINSTVQAYDNLIGKVPITANRKRPPASDRRSKRKIVYE